MKFDELQPLTIELAEQYSHYFNLSKTRIADSCPNSRFAWNCGYQYRYLIIEECLCLVSDGGVFTNPHFTLPLGELSKEKMNKILLILNEIFETENWELRGMFIDEIYQEYFENLSDFDVNWEMDEDFSDYVYETDKLINLKGKDYRSKRNHVNKFIREYPEFTYRKLQKEDREKAVHLVQSWCEEKDVDCFDPIQSDRTPIDQLFSYWDSLTILGGAIFYNDDLIAFSMGSLIRDGEEAVIHFEKADPNYEGVYALINQMTVLSEFDETQIVNREEDMGDLGLRVAKESYMPIEKIHKYRAVLKSK